MLGWIAAIVLFISGVKGGIGYVSADMCMVAASVFGTAGTLFISASLIAGAIRGLKK